MEKSWNFLSQFLCKPWNCLNAVIFLFLIIIQMAANLKYMLKKLQPEEVKVHTPDVIQKICLL